MSGLKGALLPRGKSRGEAQGRSRRGLLGIVAGAVLALGVMVAPAQAAETEYKLTGTIDLSSVENPSSLAIDQTGSSLYIPQFFPGQVNKLDLSTEPPTISSFGSGNGFGQAATVNPQNGNVYAMFNSSGERFIHTFTSGGAEVGSSFQVEETTLSGIVSDSEGNVYTPGPVGGEPAIYKYSPTGELLNTITCADCPSGSAFEDDRVAPGAVDSNDNLYVIDRPDGRVVKFDSEGNFVSVFASEVHPYSVAVDPSNDDVFIAEVTEEGPSSVLGYHSDGTQFADFGTGQIASQFGSHVAINPATGDVYVTDYKFNGSKLILVFAPSFPPVVTTGASSAITNTGATLKGTVNPNGKETTECLFEYGTTEAYGSTAPCNVDPGSGTEAVEVSAALSGLSPSTEYHYRLFSANSDGEEGGSDATFTTLAQPKPVVETKAATAISQTAGTLNGSVNAEGANASCKFEYGTTVAYGKSIACSTTPVSGEVAKAISAALSGLVANTTYHYRVVAENSGGKAEGSDMSFTTLADTCATNTALCPAPPVVTPPTTTPPVTTPPPTTKKILKCKKGFKRKTVKGKAKCVKAKKHKKHKKR